MALIGTGGLLSIFCNNLISTGSLDSQGSSGGSNTSYGEYRFGGGGSGGGSINVFTVNEPPAKNTISFNVNGGAGGKASGGSEHNHRRTGMVEQVLFQLDKLLMEVIVLNKFKCKINKNFEYKKIIK